MPCLWTRVSEIAHAEPERPALVEGERRVTYGALWADVRRFAAALEHRGVTRGGRVAVVLPNCIEAVVARYGTWLAGGVVVPLNVQASARELGRWLSVSEPCIVVHEGGNPRVEAALASLESVAPRVSGTAPPLPLVWTFGAGPDATPERPPPPRRVPTPDKLAMLLYTSGTTGEAKGVMLSHGNLVANVRAIVEYLGLTGDDSIVSGLPFYYSYGASVLHTHLSVGARVVLEPNLVFPHLVFAAIARERVTGFSGAPSTFALLVGRVNLASYDLSSLRYLSQNGGAMSPALTQRVRAALPRARLFVTYGQTEATARMTWLPPERLDDKLGSVGLPVPGTSVEVRRDSGERAGPGEVGEVWVTGDHVMLGLHKDPAGTRAAIMDGWLRTGDLGHVDDEGFLFLSGRRSDLLQTVLRRVQPCENAVAGMREAPRVGLTPADPLEAS